jgi:hypothetical protein
MMRLLQWVCAAVDRRVQAGYERGIWHSMIGHCALLLGLALVTGREPMERTMPIVIGFSESVVDSDVEVSDDGAGHLELVPIPPTGPAESASSETPLAALSVTEIQVPVLDDQTSSRMVDELVPPIVAASVVQTVAGLDRRTHPRPPAEPAAAVPVTGMTQRAGADDANVAASGVGAAIEHRLMASGAKTGDVQISLAWDTMDDIDLHVQYRSGGYGDTIWWRRCFGSTGGVLDVDMNASGPLRAMAVENIFWPTGGTPHGEFVVGVHFFRSWTGRTSVPVTVRIKSAGGVEYRQVVVHLGAAVTEVAMFRN